MQLISLCWHVLWSFLSLTVAAQSLEKEVQDVKATLQTMLAQLKGEEEEELRDHDLLKNGTEEEEEEEDEDQYFSDSWDIWNGEHSVALWQADLGSVVGCGLGFFYCKASLGGP